MNAPLVPWEGGDLHDAQLKSVVLDFEQGIITLMLIPHDHYPGQPSTIVAEDVTSVSITREQPWGPSASINDSEGPEDSRFVIEMQSGDELTITAGSFLADRT